MSVHRAGSYYGVPHSTLEYKVKERNKLRLKSRRATLVSTMPTTNLISATVMGVKNIETFDLNSDNESSSVLIKKNLLNVIKNEINNLTQNELATNEKDITDLKNQTINNNCNFIETSEQRVKTILETAATNLVDSTQNNFKLNEGETKTSKSAAASMLVALSTTA